MTVLPSIDANEAAGRVPLACGHAVDPRTWVFYHCSHGVTAVCPDCDRKQDREPLCLPLRQGATLRPDEHQRPG
jgi:hypothetical protein